MHWQQELRTSIRNVDALLARCGLDQASIADREGALDADRSWPVRVTATFVSCIAEGDPNDPLLAQVLPAGRELEPSPGFGEDPLLEARARAGPGVLQKYRGRALLEIASTCALHCRYCFRRHRRQAGLLDQGRGRDLEQVLAQLAAEPELHEVILSGGDPLMVDDDALGLLAQRLAAIPQIARLRVHTRLPVALPSRVDDRLLSWLRGTRLVPVVVIHCNHPRELGSDARQALARLAGEGVTLLSQSVLLAGVNDSVETLAALSEALLECGVVPYYLHLLDRVQGAAGFEVDEPAALELERGLRERLPGYLVPRIVREVPGAAFKLPLQGCGARLAGDGAEADL